MSNHGGQLHTKELNGEPPSNTSQVIKRLSAREIRLTYRSTNVWSSLPRHAKQTSSTSGFKSLYNN